MTETPAERTARLALDLGRARRELAEAREEIAEYGPLLERQSQLLTGVANALKGPPPELTTWSHDLPELAQTFADRLAAVEAELDDADVMYLDGMGVLAVEERKVRAALARHAEADPKNSDDLPLAAATHPSNEGALS